MSDAKFIDDIDNPDLNADAITDEENETKTDPSSDTDVEVANEEESAEPQDDTPEETDDGDENNALTEDPAESTDQETEGEVEKQDDVEAEEESTEAQDDTPEETNNEDENNVLADDPAESTDQEPESEEENQDDIPEETDNEDENDALAENPAESTDQEPESEEKKQDDVEAEEESTESQDDIPEETDNEDENNALADDPAESTDQEPESEVEKQDDVEAEEETTEAQDDIPEETDNEDENDALAENPAESTDQEPESEEEKQDDVAEEEDGAEAQDDDSKETDDIEEQHDFASDTAEESDEVEKGKSEDKSKLFKILKWTAIILLPLITTASLLFLKPALITTLFNKTELQVHTPKTAAIQWTAEELEMINVVGQTLTETEKIWHTIFTQKGGIYKKPDFTIFTGRINSACAKEQEDGQVIEKSSIGTFYCPEERRIYIDLSLQLDLKNRLDIPGDFAQGYIVAHEIGHHVQNLAKISEQIPAARIQLNDKEFEMVIQRLELQADCFAGIWAKHNAESQYNVRPEEFADVLDSVSHYSRKILKQKEENDIMPDPFTHGSPRLRLRWFNIGFEKGTFDSCDTFTVMEL